MGFILATIGSAVGLGNIWRFSYLTYENGGGAFLVPYFIAIFTAGISLMVLEFSLGSKFRGAAPLAFKRARKGFECIGWWAVITGSIITMYYSVIVSWALVYIQKAFTLAWGNDTGAYFIGTVLQRSDSPWELGGFPPSVILALIAIWFITWLIEVKGVQAGIEKASRVFIPLLFVLTLLLVVRSLTLPGAMNGIDWYLKPNFEVLFDYRVWLAAYGQVFYTLGLGMAIMITYSSYLPEKSDIVNNCMIVSLANGAYSFLMGFAIFGTLGYMAHVKNLGIEEVVADGIGLAFIVIPEALNTLPGLKTLTAVIFFISFGIAGLSSLISLVEAFVSTIMDRFQMERKKAANLTIGIGFAGSLIYATKGGLYWLDIIDHFINIYGLMLVGLIEAVAIGWIFGAAKIKEWANAHSEIRAGIWWDISIKLIVPLVLGILIIQETLTNLAAPYGGDSLAAYTGIAVIIMGMILAALLPSVKKEVM